LKRRSLLQSEVYQRKTPRRRPLLRRKNRTKRRNSSQSVTMRRRKESHSEGPQRDIGVFHLILLLIQMRVSKKVKVVSIYPHNHDL
jgi:hypothetical protein